MISGSVALVLTGQSPSNEAVLPFTINTSDETLSDLQTRIRSTRFPDEIPDSDWDYGTNRTYLQELVKYWQKEFDWRAQEQRLNKFNQYKTNINGLNIHFIHQRSTHANAMPLLLLNGWPSSIDEYSKVIGPLTDPVRYGGSANHAFHVIIPSMPGYGFSDKPRTSGFDTEQMSEFWVTLMSRLGYTKYGTHASDWGSGVANWLARKDAQHMVGLHLIGCEGVLRSAVPLGKPADMEVDGFGYVEIQSTKVQTIGYGLTDSPVGLAAWIIEKYHGWSDHDGNIEHTYTKDELLTNIMIYWVTNSITSASRLYYESRHGTPRPTSPITVPVGCAGFVERYDQRARTDDEARTVAEQRYNIVRWTEMPRGGHFPALEQPDLWLADVRAFFADLR
jgi:pimeloyl-ACP methyl ester carboxylesterase